MKPPCAATCHEAANLPCLVPTLLACSAQPWRQLLNPAEEGLIDL
jgi:hypothetical protein